jgi:hypothetical protein
MRHAPVKHAAWRAIGSGEHIHASAIRPTRDLLLSIAAVGLMPS